MLKLRETIIFLVTTAGIIILTILQHEEVFIIYSIGEILLYFIFGCTLIYSAIRLIKDRRQVSFFNKARPLIFGVIMTGFFFFLSHLVDTDGLKKTTMTAGFNHDLHSVQLKLFEDKKFKLVNLGPFGGEILRGSYTLTNNTLRLDNDNLKYLYPSLMFVLKKMRIRKNTSILLIH